VARDAGSDSQVDEADMAAAVIPQLLSLTWTGHRPLLGGVSSIKYHGRPVHNSKVTDSRRNHDFYSSRPRESSAIPFI
jgi:hypothetical protein